MSDSNPTTMAQAMEYLHQRESELAMECEITRDRYRDVQAQLDEVRRAIAMMNRPKRGRPKGSANSTKPADTQPGPYDDSVSIGEVRGILREGPLDREAQSEAAL